MKKKNTNFNNKIESNGITRPRKLTEVLNIAGVEMGNDEGKCRSSINKLVKNMGCKKLKTEMENKSTVRYYKEKEKTKKNFMMEVGK